MRTYDEAVERVHEALNLTSTTGLLDAVAHVYGQCAEKFDNGPEKDIDAAAFYRRLSRRVQRLAHNVHRER
jgi:hypothetical protein